MRCGTGLRSFSFGYRTGEILHDSPNYYDQLYSQFAIKFPNLEEFTDGCWKNNAYLILNYVKELNYETKLKEVVYVSSQWYHKGRFSVEELVKLVSKCPHVS